MFYRNDTAAVFTRHRAASGAGEGGRGDRILRRDQVSHEIPASISCSEETCTSFRFRLYLLLSCLDPLSLSRSACCRKSSCVTGIVIFRDVASTFSTKLTPNSYAPISSLTHCCYGLPPYIDFAASLFLHSRNTFILSSECLGTS